MANKNKKISLKDFLPPVLLKLLDHLKKRRKRKAWSSGVEQPSEFYDETFLKAEHWKRHYTKSPYYPLWTVILDRVRRSGVTSFLDIGCGPGQFALMLKEHGYSSYLGVDFSKERIEYARSICPSFQFFQEDVFSSGRLTNC